MFWRMDLELLPNITLQTGTFNAIIAPEEMILGGINDNPVLQRYTCLFICGNFSRLLSRIDRKSNHFHIQRAFTAHQLLTILQETYHTVVFLEHDSSIYDDAGEVKFMIPHALKEISHDKIVVLYTTKMDHHLSFLTRYADCVFLFESSNENSKSQKRHLLKSHNREISDYCSIEKTTKWITGGEIVQLNTKRHPYVLQKSVIV